MCVCVCERERVRERDLLGTISITVNSCVFDVCVMCLRGCAAGSAHLFIILFIIYYFLFYVCVMCLLGCAAGSAHRQSLSARRHANGCFVRGRVVRGGSVR